jgi:hypothetical protein
MLWVILMSTTMAAMMAAHNLNQRFWPRKHGEIRPSSAWLISGAGISVSFTLLSVFYIPSISLAMMPFTLAVAASGVAMIGFYFHRRILFRKHALYHVRSGRVIGGVPYACAWQCQIGENLEREGLVIQGVGARRWNIPGATSRRALSEALWCLRNAGVKLPQEEALVRRLGITPAMIEAAAR